MGQSKRRGKHLNLSYENPTHRVWRVAEIDKNNNSRSMHCFVVSKKKSKIHISV